MQFKILDSRPRTLLKPYDEMDLKLVEIKIASSTRPELVLDCSKFKVTLEKYTGKPTQRWFIQGRYIRSSYNG